MYTVEEVYCYKHSGRRFCVDTFSYLLRKHLGVKLLNYVITLYLASTSCVTVPKMSHQQGIRVPISLHPPLDY